MTSSAFYRMAPFSRSPSWWTLHNADATIANDWNPAGIAIDEAAGRGVRVCGGTASGGGVVRVAPDLTFEQIAKLGGQGMDVDDLAICMWLESPESVDPPTPW